MVSFFHGSLPKPYMHFSFPHKHHMPCPSHPPSFDHQVDVLQWYKLWSSLLCSFLQHPISHVLVSNIFLGIPFFDTLSLFIHSFIHSFIPLACAECDDSSPFSGASSIPLCYVLFPATLLHQLLFHPLSPHLTTYFLVYLSILLFPNSYIIPF